MSFLGELRRRKVFRVAATYVVASWLIIQVVSAVDAPLNLPDWFDTVVVIFLAIGFPIAILFAWAFEMTPDGIRATRSGESGDIQLVSNKLDYALIGALMIVAVSTSWNQFGFQTDQGNPSSASIPIDKSIAVLPFADMSPDGDQEYFGDGIAEELLNELTNLDGLTVAGRTSSFSFKGRDDDIRGIGEALNVSLILEGSVRKDGDRVRITAQLIDAATGYHHWSETYDRNLTDIFAIQDEIAASIAGVLGVRLGVGDINSFEGAGTDSVEAYEAYLQAIQIPMTRLDRIQPLETAVQLDPNYAAALAALGLSIASTMWISQPEEAPEILDRAIPILLRAVELRPDSAYAYSLLATANYARFDWIESEEYHERALANSRYGTTLLNYGNMLMRAGRSEAALQVYGDATSAEKYPARISPNFLNAYLSLGRYAEAAEYASQNSNNTLLNINYLIALNDGDPAAIKAAIGAISRNEVSVSVLIDQLLPILESPEEALVFLNSVFADTNIVWPSKYHDIALLAAYFGDPEFSLQVFSIEARLTTIRLGALWYPVMSEVRKLPEFKDLMSEINLLKYWRAYGWSSHCRPLGEDDFECF